MNKRFTKQEEIANSISHGMGALLSVVALVLLTIIATRHGGTRYVVSVIVFGSSMVLLYLSSTFNHALRIGTKAKEFFHNFDQVAIYLLIAGTYTPLSLIVLNGDWGWTMFGAQWGFAVTGIVIKIIYPNNFNKGVNVFYLISYIVMGWMLLFFLFPLLRNMATMGLVLIFIGGGCYTLGTLFFKFEKIPYAHFIWHLFVMAGSVCHFAAIYKYVLPHAAQ